MSYSPNPPLGEADVFHPRPYHRDDVPNRVTFDSPRRLYVVSASTFTNPWKHAIKNRALERVRVHRRA
jgi:hypothetical protein